MQEIIKQVGSSRQLFETVNFAFMKIFDFLVKIARSYDHRARFSAVICDTNHPEKAERPKGLF